MEQIANIFSWLYEHSPLLYLTQSLWRDEAFAVSIARQPPSKIVAISAGDFNPPLHYLLLHGWMILFGDSEIALRMLSFLFYLLLLIVAYRFSCFLFSKRDKVILMLLLSLNPMLLTYAFEVRMYSMYAFLATLSTYALYRNKWLLYIVSSTLGLYTHSYMSLTLFVHLLYILIIKAKSYLTTYIPLANRNDKVLARSYFFSLVAIGIFFLPWLPVLISQWQKSRESWIYPIDLQLVASSLGNLYLSYEGTPPGWWWATRLVSLTIVIGVTYVLKKHFKTVLLFALWLIIPVFIILSISFMKPLFVNRYLIFVAVAETFLIILVLRSINNTVIRKILLVMILSLLIAVNLFHPPFKKKLDTRSVFKELNKTAEVDAVIITDSLVYFDGLYYYSDPNQVFIYRPENVYIPIYVGMAAISKDKILKELPKNRPLYFVDKNGSVVKKREVSP